MRARRKTTCPVPGHGTRCEAARERDDRYPRPTETRAALRYEDTANGACYADGCRLYFCPTSGDVDCPTHGGFDTCCDQPELHRPPDRPGPCMAVWRDPADQVLVACADEAPPGQCWCAWHKVRANGRVNPFARRAEAVRTVSPTALGQMGADR